MVKQYAKAFTAFVVAALTQLGIELSQDGIEWGNAARAVVSAGIVAAVVWLVPNTPAEG